MVYCLCSDKDNHVIKTFDSFIAAMVYNICYNDFYVDGTYVQFLDL